MAKRKPDTLTKRGDPAAKYRAKLEARRAAVHETQTARWSPGIGDRLTLTFSRLLYTATAPTTKSSGLTKRLLERWLLGAAARDAAHRKTLYRASKAVLSAGRIRNPVTFKQSGDELNRLWKEVRAGGRAGRFKQQ